MKGELRVVTVERDLLREKLKAYHRTHNMIASNG